MRGLLYDQASLDGLYAALEMSPAQHQALHLAAQRDGMRAVANGVAVKDLAREVLTLAKAGLSRLDPADVPLLAPLEAIVEAGAARAEGVLAAFTSRKSDAAFLAQF
jgi:glutamate--cysteine ligase